MDERVAVALITDVFFDDPDGARLRRRLTEARRLGAELAVLPELPLNPWSPATKEAVEGDAEPPGGPRQARLQAAAREVGIALLGGAIVRQPSGGERHNTALLYDAAGTLLASYRKLHLPAEEGYWETCHYQPGDAPPPVADGWRMPLGLQICSDVNRPQGCQLLAAQGAEAILAPRCTPAASYERWRLVLRADAVTSAAYVVSVNRPRPELGVPIGGASLVVDPSGEVILESSEPVAVATLDRAAVRRARADYPGYLPSRAEVYAAGWQRLASGTST